MADALVSEASAARYEGSTPSLRINTAEKGTFPEKGTFLFFL